MSDPVTDNLQKRFRLIGLLAPSLIVINSIGISLCLLVLFKLSGSINERSGMNLMEAIKSDFSEFETLDAETRASMNQMKDLELKVDFELSEVGVLGLTDTVMKTERNSQVFLRLLKVNIYNLTGHIPGTASWYELYAPIIDAAIERSRVRQLRLLQVKQHYQDAA